MNVRRLRARLDRLEQKFPVPPPVCKPIDDDDDSTDFEVFCERERRLADERRSRSLP